jgi:hypothetical protein
MSPQVKSEYPIQIISTLSNEDNLVCHPNPLLKFGLNSAENMAVMVVMLNEVKHLIIFRFFTFGSE